MLLRILVYTSAFLLVFGNSVLAQPKRGGKSPRSGHKMGHSMKRGGPSQARGQHMRRGGQGKAKSMHRGNRGNGRKAVHKRNAGHRSQGSHQVRKTQHQRKNMHQDRRGPQDERAFGKHKKAMHKQHKREALRRGAAGQQGQHPRRPENRGFSDRAPIKPFAQQEGAQESGQFPQHRRPPFPIEEGSSEFDYESDSGSQGYGFDESYDDGEYYDDEEYYDDGGYSDAGIDGSQLNDRKGWRHRQKMKKRAMMRQKAKRKANRLRHKAQDVRQKSNDHRRGAMKAKKHQNKKSMRNQRGSQGRKNIRANPARRHGGKTRR